MFAFSGDPTHYGHVDIINRASGLFEEVIAAIGVNDSKKYLFSLDERKEMAKLALGHLPNVSLVSYEGLTVDYAYENNIPVIVKGVRTSEDFNYEKMLHEIGESQELGIETFHMFSKPELSHVSSSTVKAVQKEHGLIHEFVPLHVKQKLEEKISGQYILGVTGEIGCGKSYTSRKFEELGARKGIGVLNIDLDKIGHEILSTRKEPRYESVRQQIVDKFGRNVRLEDGTINRKVLGEIVFNDYSKLKELNNIMHTPILVRYRKALDGHKGIVLLNAALIAESNLGYLCNNNVLLINVDKKTQERRLKEERRLETAQIERRLGSQYNFEGKKEKLEEAINAANHGNIWIHQSYDKDNKKEIEETFDWIAYDLGLIKY